MFVGPVFFREAVIVPRRRKLYFLRSVYLVMLLILMSTAWLVVAGTQVIRTVGDIARFGVILFQILAPVQLALIGFGSAVFAASGVSQEKDKQTLLLLMMTRLNNSELVLGRLLASLLQVGVVIGVSIPVLLAVSLFGGVSIAQVLWAVAITASSSLAAGSLGSTIALWREKTFQALALTIMVLVAWMGVWEATALVASYQANSTLLFWANSLNPIRAVLFATDPLYLTTAPLELLTYCSFALLTTFALNVLSIARIRVWNPGREVRPQQATQNEGEGTASSTTQVHTASTADHIDAQPKSKVELPSREVRGNPVLWREMSTWAYGKKVVFIRLAFWLLTLAVAAGLYASAADLAGKANQVGTEVPVAAKLAGPYFLLSIILINALAVTSITNERDGKTIDILLVTDITPKEFLFGKLLGILYVTRDMVVLPLFISVMLWWLGAISLENLAYLIVGLLMMTVFVAALGIHCGSTYVNSRQAISVSLGTVFFLFLGIMTCMYMMVSLGSFQGQLPPFLAFIVGGGIGLYVALGYRNASPAIVVSSATLPFAMFFVITSFLIQRYLSVFLVMMAAYGFTVMAIMMPALGEFVVAMGRGRTLEDE